MLLPLKVLVPHNAPVHFAFMQNLLQHFELSLIAKSTPHKRSLLGMRILTRRFECCCSIGDLPLPQVDPAQRRVVPLPVCVFLAELVTLQQLEVSDGRAVSTAWRPRCADKRRPTMRGHACSQASRVESVHPVQLFQHLIVSRECSLCSSN